VTSSDLTERPAGDAEEATRPVPSRRRWIVAAGVAVVVLVLALALRSCLSDGGQAGGPDATSPSSTLDPATQAAIDTAVGKAVDARGLPASKIFQRILPSVVLVEVGGGGGGDGSAGLGTGVIVNADGTVLTADHVVAGATTITLTYADGTTSAATLTGSDPQMDIATLAPETLPGVLVPATLGGGGKVGDPVVAVGNPFGLVDSTTSGVISGLDRSARAEDGVQRSGLIQFDAAVNPGNSGGPLLNGRGEVIGIVTALANPTEDRSFIGIGFAVPIQTAVAGGGAEPPK
jgi:S1-C subfamily serine protease